MWELYDALVASARQEIGAAGEGGATETAGTRNENGGIPEAAMARRETAGVAGSAGALGQTGTPNLAGTPVVTSAHVSPIWTTVRAMIGATGRPTTDVLGLALTLAEPSGRRPSRCGQLAGMSLAELMGDVTAWSFADASLGLAAINAVINRRDAFAARQGASDPRVVVGERASIFGGFEGLMRDKRVCLIGHGPFAEKLAQICELTVLERAPKEGDLPDPACEYVLPSQDFVFITASALINKTMPRLLELSEHATTVIWGPSSPLSPALLDAGADAILGNIVTNPAAVERITGEGGIVTQFSAYLEPVALFADESLTERYRQAERALAEDAARPR